ncbi:thermonuclease family protein [Desulfobacula sp.]|uniref:thermonuclease family protein n=1 Tax=Desulfobacula sp. TaxID=2593537 RepID=UPI00261985D8|nr:thermonuclease family protein [Desulfobacula sp.]
MGKIFRQTVFLFLIAIFLVTGISFAQAPIKGKVVGIADGDTITVLQNNKQYIIRLYGIDTPEKGQDFGTKAKNFTSNLVFKREVKVIQKDVDRYGRIVGIVYVGEICINQEIIKAGLAWVYRQYCKDGFCRDWINLETHARKNQIGLWSHPDPVPPWEYRRGGKASFKTDNKTLKIVANVYHGNRRSNVFHQASCKDFNCKNCTVIFHSREEAIKAGYRPCGRCKP